MAETDDLDEREQLRALYETVRQSYPEAERLASSASTLHALAVLDAAQSQETSSKRIETATERLASFSMWLMIATGVLAAATIALVIATAAAK